MCTANYILKNLEHKYKLLRSIQSPTSAFMTLHIISVVNSMPSLCEDFRLFTQQRERKPEDPGCSHTSATKQHPPNSTPTAPKYLQNPPFSVHSCY